MLPPGGQDSARPPVLVVDDDEDIRETLGLALELEGYDAATVANGAQALAWLRERDPPSLILLDLMMPVMDGWALLAKLEADTRLASVPVLVLTAFGRDLGAASRRPILRKPVELGELLESVAQYTSPA